MTVMLYTERVEFATQVIRQLFDLEVKSSVYFIKQGRNFFTHIFNVGKPDPIDPDYPDPEPTAPPITLPKCSTHGTSPLPPDTSQLVFRIPNPETSNNGSSRIENEVAALAIVRRFAPSVPVPTVYAWSKEDEATAFMISQVMKGKPCGTFFNKLENFHKKKVGKNIAKIAGALRQITLDFPAQTRFGGFAFDENGEVQAGPLTYGNWGGPYASYVEMYRGILDAQLKATDRNLITKGWREDGLRDRIDRFVTDDWQRTASNLPSPKKPVFVHGDLGPHNVLVDEYTMEITGVIDFEFSIAASSAEEYFYSYQELGHFVTSFCEDWPTERLLHDFLTPEGSITSLPDKYTGEEELDVPWPVVKAFNDALVQEGVPVPNTIPAFADIARLHWFAQDLCQWFFLDEEEDYDTKDRLIIARQQIENALKHWGY